MLLGECFVVVDAEEAEKKVGDVDARAGGLERLKEERKVLRGIGGAQDGALTRTKPNETKRKD